MLMTFIVILYLQSGLHLNKFEISLNFYSLKILEKVKSQLNGAFNKHRYWKETIKDSSLLNTKEDLTDNIKAQ